MEKIEIINKIDRQEIVVTIPRESGVNANALLYTLEYLILEEKQGTAPRATYLTSFAILEAVIIVSLWIAFFM